MLFNSINFLLFFPIVVAIYFLLPKNIRYIWLLISSYYFYMSWGKKQGLLLLGITFITYLSGILLEKIKSRNRSEEKNLRAEKICLGVTVVLNLALLCYFKYLNYLLGLCNRILGTLQSGKSISIAEIVLPIGISCTLSEYMSKG